MGQRHAEALKRLDITLVAAADPLQTATSQVVHAWHGEAAPIACTSLAELLLVQVPELLVVATTADGHAAQALQAMEAGVRMILLEELVATTLARHVSVPELAFG